MTRIRNIEREADTGVSLEKLTHRAKKHNVKIDRQAEKIIERMKEQIEELSKANLRLSKIVNKVAHFLPREKMEELRREVDSLSSLDPNGV